MKAVDGDEAMRSDWERRRPVWAGRSIVAQNQVTRVAKQVVKVKKAVRGGDRLLREGKVAAQKFVSMMSKQSQKFPSQIPKL